jgi:hypothetical protein
LAGSFALHGLFAQDKGPATPPKEPPKAPLEVLRLSRNVPGDSKPILIDADDVATWVEPDGRGERRALILRGKVLVEQNVVQARFPLGVAWIDLQRYRQTGLLCMQLYAEGGVKVDSGLETKEAARAVLEVVTRGEFRVRTHRNKVVQQSFMEDPLVKRGRGEGLGPADLRAPAVVGASGEGVQRTGLQQPAPAPKPPPPVPLSLPVSPTDMPAPPGKPGAPPGATSALPPAAFFVRGAAPELTDAPPPLRTNPTNPEAAPSPVPPPLVLPAPSTLGSNPSSSSSSNPPPEPPPPGAPGPPGPAPPGPTPLPPPSRQTPPPPGAAPAPIRNFSVQPRRGRNFDVIVTPAGPDGEQATVITGGVILLVRNAPNMGIVDMEADRLVFWTRGGNAQKLLGGMQSAEGQEANDLEFYLAGNVEVRQQAANNIKESRTLKCDEIYYDVNRHVAVAIKARLELRELQLPDTPFVLNAAELFQINENLFEMNKAEVFASKLPSDPGLKVYMTDATIEDRTIPMTSIFGRPVVDRRTGLPLEQKQSIVTGHNALFELESVPFLYLPYFSGDARDPLGPIQDINFGYSRIYGFQFGLTLNVYQLLGLQPPPATSWRLNLDYLSYRGPGIGSSYDSASKDFFGLSAVETTSIKAYAMYDRNFDVLGGFRPMNNFDPPNFRGRFTFRESVQDLPEGYSILAQVSALSDRNFLEQYFKREFDSDWNQATFIYGKQQKDNWALTALVEPRIRNWVTETQWLPRLDGYLIGQSLWDRLTYSAHADAALAYLRLTSDSSNPVSTTDVRDFTGRFDYMQELSLPLAAGPFKIVPYARLDTALYTNSALIDGDTLGRAWGAGGVRASIPFTRIYPDVCSEFFNLNGINHKIVVSADYVYARTSTSHLSLPQLDRLNDDATDQALRDIRPLEPFINPGNGQFLITSPLFDPQTYAIRRLLYDRIDTLDNIEELTLDVRQRWQTKRGYPGFQHIEDYITLDLSASYFPNSVRDNFGQPFAFLEYNFVWNIGDRTALESTAWVDPITNGPRVYTVGAFFNRTDRTSFYVGYREIEPVQSRALTGAVTYVFSPKYALTASSTYDFGTSLALSNSVLFTRMGSDLQVTVGFTYNALQNNFGAVFQLVPVLVPPNRAPTVAGGLGGGGFLH